MGKFIFIIGGARSGKSRYAEKLAGGIARRVAFIATSVPGDKEMKRRIALHKKSRPRSWKTIEEPKNLSAAIKALGNKFDAVVIDCLGIFLSNLLLDDKSDKEIEKEVKKVAYILSKADFTSIMVSNEVGEGIVPDNPLGRKFRDALGLANQIMAEKADTVISMHAGIPLVLKEGIKNAKVK